MTAAAPTNPTSAEGQMIPCSQHQIDESDEQAVLRALRSGILTMGPEVEALEREFAAYVGARHAIAVSSGTAALHAAVVALGLPPGSAIAVPAITFVATAHAVAAAGHRVVFVDVNPETLLLLEPFALPTARDVFGRVAAIIGVDFAGQPANYEAFQTCGVPVIADAAHSLGARAWNGRKVGTLATATCFSLHPSKLITAAEGGVVTTDDDELAVRVRRFRQHGRDFAGADGRSWAVGLNYRLSELHAALARSQLARAEWFLAYREALAAVYDREFMPGGPVRPLGVRPGVRHGRHLYVVQIEKPHAAAVRAALQERGFGATLHYHPLHREPSSGVADRFWAAQRVPDHYLTLPLHCGLTEDDIRGIARAVKEVAA